MWNAAFAPDDKLIASNSGILLKMWDANSEKPVAILPSGIMGCGSYAFTPDGKWLLHGVGGLMGDDVRCASTRDWQDSELHTGSCSHIAVSPCGRFLAVCYDSNASGPHSRGTIEILGLPEGKLIKKIVGTRADVAAVCYSPDGRYIAGAELDAGLEADGNAKTLQAGTISIWDAQSGTVVRSVPCPGMSPEAILYSPDGRMIAVQLRPAKGYSRDEKMPISVALYDVETAGRFALLPGSICSWTGYPARAFSPDGKHLVLASEDGTAKIWQVR